MKKLFLVLHFAFYALLLQSQNIGVGTTTPKTRLHVVDSSVVFSADNDVLSTPGKIGVNGAGRRMLWYADKAAFRAGYVSGGQWNKDSIGNYSFAAGDNSVAKGDASAAFGVSAARGFGSFATGLGANAEGFTSVALGTDADAFGDYSVAIGYTVSAGEVSVAMGSNAVADGYCASIGMNTTATGYGSTALGYYTTASGAHSTALGNYAGTSGHAGSFSIGDNTGTSAALIGSTADNQMSMRFDGGYRLYSNNAKTAGVTLASGGGSWTAVSDRRLKENFRTINAEDLLNKVATLPITNWNYKSQPASQRHIGPMAQDFYAAFHLDGEGADTTINTMDISGVNMAAIQALEKRTAALKKENEELKARLQKLEALVLKKQ